MLIKDYINETMYNFIRSTKEQPVYAIGDVHGCADEFYELVDKIYSQNPNAIIYQLGDLIDRGPHLLDVFRICKDFNIRTLMGNHEYNFWLEVCDSRECRSLSRKETHEKFKKLKTKHQDMIIEMIASSKNYEVVLGPSGGFMLSHAPLDKNRATRLNSCVLNYCLTSEQDDPNMREQHNIHGHTHWEYKPIEEQLIRENNPKKCYNIDSGVVYGGYLTALNITDLSFIQVKSKQTYFKE